MLQVHRYLFLSVSVMELQQMYLNNIKHGWRILTYCACTVMYLKFQRVVWFSGSLMLEIWKKTFNFNSNYGGDISLLKNLRILCNEPTVAPQNNVLPNREYARLQNCFLDHWIHHEVCVFSCSIPFVYIIISVWLISAVYKVSSLYYTYEVYECGSV